MVNRYQSNSLFEFQRTNEVTNSEHKIKVGESHSWLWSSGFLLNEWMNEWMNEKYIYLKSTKTFINDKRKLIVWANLPCIVHG